MRLTRVPMIAMLVSSVLHVPLCWLYVYGFDMGVVGLAVASSSRELILLTFLVCYCNWSDQISKALVNPFSKDTFSGWGTYLKVSLPSTALICAEMWVF